MFTYFRYIRLIKYISKINFSIQFLKTCSQNIRNYTFGSRCLSSAHLKSATPYRYHYSIEFKHPALWCSHSSKSVTLLLRSTDPPDSCCPSSLSLHFRSLPCSAHPAHQRAAPCLSLPAPLHAPANPSPRGHPALLSPRLHLHSRKQNPLTAQALLPSLPFSLELARIGLLSSPFHSFSSKSHLTSMLLDAQSVLHMCLTWPSAALDTEDHALCSETFLQVPPPPGFPSLVVLILFASFPSFSGYPVPSVWMSLSIHTPTTGFHLAQSFKNLLHAESTDKSSWSPGLTSKLHTHICDSLFNTSTWHLKVKTSKTQLVFSSPLLPNLWLPSSSQSQ